MDRRKQTYMPDVVHADSDNQSVNSPTHSANVIVDGSKPETSFKVTYDFFKEHLSNRQGFNTIQNCQYFDMTHMLRRPERYDNMKFVLNRDALSQLIRDDENDLARHDQYNIFNSFAGAVWTSILSGDSDFVFLIQDRTHAGGVRPVRGTISVIDGKVIVCAATKDNTPSAKPQQRASLLPS